MVAGDVLDATDVEQDGGVNQGLSKKVNHVGAGTYEVE
jgi:hypothetical protein